MDETLIRFWIYHDAKTDVDSYYKFLADGTFELYAGAVTEANKSKGRNRWKIEAGGYDKNGVAVLDLTCADGGFTQREELKKRITLQQVSRLSLWMPLSCLYRRLIKRRGNSMS
jgi:hypothetical protein